MVAGVDEYQPGAEVYGTTRGTFAEYTVAPTGTVASKPPQLSFEQAAVLPYPTFVAMAALRDHGHMQPGQRVLVVGASGAVGSIAVQRPTNLARGVGEWLRKRKRPSRYP